jgi:hypothetical protein
MHQPAGKAQQTHQARFQRHWQIMDTYSWKPVKL